MRYLLFSKGRSCDEFRIHSNWSWVDRWEIFVTVHDDVGHVVLYRAFLEDVVIEVVRLAHFAEDNLADDVSGSHDAVHRQWVRV